MSYFFKKTTCIADKCEYNYRSCILSINYDIPATIYEILKCGRSSVVERHVANVNVVSSNLIARFRRSFPKDRAPITYCVKGTL